ncbi:MAG: hypothetical protein MR902_04255 [Campylobacter sp.]|nr:hypothetical protein [Campylobacter sp.]
MEVKAFTLIELVIIIVVVGILAAAITPRLDKNPLIEATDQIVSHINYTKHLAMMDHSYNPNDTVWFKKRWTIEFSHSKSPQDSDYKPKWRYSIYKDSSGSGNLNSINEVARVPGSPEKVLSGGASGFDFTNAGYTISQNMNLTKKYDILKVEFLDNCGKNSNQSISFDRYGRPYLKVSTTSGGGSTSPTDRKLKSNCVINLANSNGDTTSITIHPETGFVTKVIN